MKVKNLKTFINGLNDNDTILVNIRTYSFVNEILDLDIDKAKWESIVKKLSNDWYDINDAIDNKIVKEVYNYD